MESYDVAVIGGGPAGSTAAYHLATAGASVLLLDKATFPRDKPCGGGVTGRAARQLPFSIAPVVEDVVDRMECGLRYGNHVTRRAGTPLAYMTQRRRLDHFLLQKAAEAGAEVREGETADARELDARIVIGADGCNGASAKQLGLADRISYGVALEANYPYEARYSGAIVLEIAIIRGGYGWIFAKGDHLNVGVGGNSSEAPKLRAELRKMCEAYGIDPDAAQDMRGYRLPMRMPRTQLARGTTAVIGDAAGLVDPLSGDGIYEAALSARLAADAALDVLAGRSPDMSRYAAQVARALGRLHAGSWRAKRAIDRFPRATYEIVKTPFAWRIVEQLLRGEVANPSDVRGLSRAAFRLVERMGRRETANASG
jgi:geranylgeranyl reductase family protein